MPSELAYVLGGFMERFAPWRGSRIVLHGAREYARGIAKTFAEALGIEAVVMDEPDGERFGGLPFWNEDRLFFEHPDLVILTERVRHAEAVYQRIGARCREAGIALYDMYGLDWLAMRDELDAQSPLALGEWAELASPYDVVTFELPECVMAPIDGEQGPTFACHPLMRRLINLLEAGGTRTVFIGRGPYPEEEQRRLLAASGLLQPGESLEGRFFMRSGEDGSWHAIRARYPNARILNIGYGLAKEGVLPRYYGADSHLMAPGGLVEPVFDDKRRDWHIENALDPQGLCHRLEAAIERADTVSFDIFDTLVSRTTLVPTDVFALVEERACAAGIAAEGYLQARLDAQSDLSNYNAARIYRAVGKRLGLDEDDLARIYESELRVEQETLVPRAPMVELYRHALELGKRVVLVSDMYHSADTLASLLDSLGIRGYEGLIVSSEHGRLKCQGLFEELLALRHTGRIVHIGNYVYADVKQSERLGIEAVLVPSPFDLALAYGAVSAEQADAPLAQRCGFGREIAAAFENPFATYDVGCVPGPAVPFPEAPADSAPFAGRRCVSVAPHELDIPVLQRQGLLGWYPFPHGGAALLLGSDLEAHMPVLEKTFDSVDTAIGDDASYRCIVFLDPLAHGAALSSLLERLRGALAPDGVMLIGFRNRFGAKYLCGAVDNAVDHPFDTLAPNHDGSFGRTEMEELARAAGLQTCATYLVMPDAAAPQAVYTDASIPETGIHDRVLPCDLHSSPLVASEHGLYPALAAEGLLAPLANYLIVECRLTEAPKGAARVTQAALSLDRGPERSTMTLLMDDGQARKVVVSPQGRSALATLQENCGALRRRGLAVVDSRLDGDELVMPLVEEQALLARIAELSAQGPEPLIALFGQLYADVLRSSDPCDPDDTDMLEGWGMAAAELGPILATGYIDMVPYNAFWTGSGIRWFDQEFTVPRCPAAYVLFRALRYTWIHLPALEEVLPLARAKEHFGLDQMWDAFEEKEMAFLSEVRGFETYQKAYGANALDLAAMARRRAALATADGGPKPYETGLLMGVFDLFHVGHLRLIERAKERCGWLRVAVLSDKLVTSLKGITPTIPLEQRMEVLAAIEGVDEVVAVHDRPSRVLEWTRRPFDCFFSGDDYTENADWDAERDELLSLGVKTEFFPYTESQSSSKIRKSLAEQACP